MTYIPDLATCDYFGFDHGGHLIAIGWLDRSHDYSRGKVKKNDYLHLKHLLVHPLQPVTFFGTHECNLCQFNGPHGIKNLFIPDAGDILVAPELIKHYINCHHYKPPNRFLKAIKRLSSSRNMDYKKALLANNGSFLLPSKRRKY